MIVEDFGDSCNSFRKGKYFPKVIKCVADLGLGNKFLNLQTCTLHHMIFNWPLGERGGKMGEEGRIGID